jgi:hypothetical protein
VIQPYGIAGSSCKVEIINIGQRNGEWYECQLAVDGKLAIPFSVHAEDWRNYPSEDKRLEMLTRQAISLLDEFGDARSQPRIEGGL